MHRRGGRRAFPFAPRASHFAGMTRVASIFGGLAATFAAVLPAAAAENASAPAHAAIVDPAGVRVNWALAQPSVRGVPVGANFIGTMPSMGIGMLMPGNARLTVRRQDETGEPVTAPTSFEVVTTQGDEALIVKTGGSAELRLTSDGAIVGGSLLGGAAASIAVARPGLTLTSNGPGLSFETAPLTVVVQYN